MSKSLLSLFTKERPWANHSPCSLEKINVINLLVIRANCFQKRAICSKKFIFFVCFHCFSPFYAKEWIAPIAIFSRAAGLILSYRSLQKIYHEHYTPVSLYKRATDAISSFPRANCSFSLLLTKNKRFPRKTKEWIPNPDYCTLYKVKLRFLRKFR